MTDTTRAIELAKHVVDVSKHVRPGELNATLDAGYFIIPASLIDSSGEWLQGVKVLKEDSTVNWPLKPTVYLDLEEYYLII